MGRGGRGWFVVLLASAVATSAACDSATTPPDRDASDDASAPTAADPSTDPGPLLSSLADAASVDGGADGTMPACALVGPPAPSAGRVLVWSDEFDGDSVDESKWTFERGYQGHATIMNTSSPDHAAVRDGSLFIDIAQNASDPVYPYVSAFLDTLGKFARTYGRIELRARFPQAMGVWYAFWATPWNALLPELDVEVLGKTPTQMWFVNHWSTAPVPADQRRSFATPLVDITQFHVYSIDWTPEDLDWGVDGVHAMQSVDRGVPTTPIAWRLNGWAGGWGGVPTPDVAFPVTFEVDYVRVYRVDGLMAPVLARVVSPKTHYDADDVITVEVANYDEACVHVVMFEGETTVAVAPRAPFSFAMSSLANGPHSLTFVATDGVRHTMTTLDVTVDRGD